jgi:hypothetical protein
MRCPEKRPKKESGACGVSPGKRPAADDTFHLVAGGPHRLAHTPLGLSHVQTMWNRYTHLLSRLYLYSLLLQMLAQRPAQEQNSLPARSLVRSLTSRLRNSSEKLAIYRHGFPLSRLVDRLKAHPNAW